MEGNAGVSFDVNHDDLGMNSDVEEGAAEINLATLGPVRPQFDRGNAGVSFDVNHDDLGMNADVEEGAAEINLVTLGPVRAQFDREARFQAQRLTSVRYRQLAMQSLERNSARESMSSFLRALSGLKGRELPDL